MDSLLDDSSVFTLVIAEDADVLTKKYSQLKQILVLNNAKITTDHHQVLILDLEAKTLNGMRSTKKNIKSSLIFGHIGLIDSSLQDTRANVIRDHIVENYQREQFQHSFLFNQEIFDATLTMESEMFPLIHLKEDLKTLDVNSFTSSLDQLFDE